MEQAEAITFLQSLLGKTLHVKVLDGRLFTGTFKCTDNESNIILGNSFEYRMPSKADEDQAIAKAVATGSTAKADMTSRFVGMIVVPGHQIVTLEVEESRAFSQDTVNTQTASSIPPLTLRTKT